MYLLLPTTHLSPRWGLGTRGFGVSIHLQDLYGSSIARDLLSYSLFVRLILSGHLIARYSLA